MLRAVTPVKNQAQCGSCWAFSTTEEIESRWAQAGHKLIELSVQQIVSCDNVDQGCNGGDTVTAYVLVRAVCAACSFLTLAANRYQYVEKAGGLELGSKYPYTSGGGDSGNCHFDKHAVVANITGYKWVTKNSDETAMKKFIANEGPISTCVDASTWQFYTGGVITSNCGRSCTWCRAIPCHLMHAPADCRCAVACVQWTIACKLSATTTISRMEPTGSCATAGVHHGASRATSTSRSARCVVCCVCAPVTET